MRGVNVTPGAATDSNAITIGADSVLVGRVGTVYDDTAAVSPVLAENNLTKHCYFVSIINMLNYFPGCELVKKSGGL